MIVWNCNLKGIDIPFTLAVLIICFFTYFATICQFVVIISNDIVIIDTKQIYKL